MTVRWPEVAEEEMALFYTTECWRLQRVCADFSRCRSVAFYPARNVEFPSFSAYHRHISMGLGRAMCQKEGEYRDGLSWRSGLEQHPVGSSGIGGGDIFLGAAQTRFPSAG